MLPRNMLVVAWLVASAMYVVLGATKIWPTLNFPPIRPNEPLGSTDSYLEPATGIAHASARILQILDRLPRDKTVVLVLPDNGVRSAFINQNVSYLAWPRDVRWLCADAPDMREQLFAMSPASVAALIFWDTQPLPNFPAGIHIGTGQVVIPITLAQAPPQS